MSAVSEDEEDDDESVTSEQSEDSISTKSSHVMSRRRSHSRNRGRDSARTSRSVSAAIINYGGKYFIHECINVIRVRLIIRLVFQLSSPNCFGFTLGCL